MTDTISLQKSVLRREMQARRATQAPQLGHKLATNVLASGLIPPQAVIGGFMPLNGEIDITPLLDELHRLHYRLALPETPPKGQPLIFRAWSPEVPLQKGRYGTLYAAAPPLTPDFLLIPLLAFDLVGNRLGYGGGYYDRTLAVLPNAFRMGCAYAAQQAEHIPTDETDQPLHAIATEQSVIRL